MILGGTIEGAGASCLLAAEVLIANNGRLRTSLLLAANALMVMVAAKNEPDEPAMARLTARLWNGMDGTAESEEEDGSSE